MRVLLAAILMLAASAGYGKLLDPETPPNPVLDSLAAGLDAQGIDVARNLNSAAAKPGRRTDKPRLGRLADMPSGTLADAGQLSRWEAALDAGSLAGIAALAVSSSAPDTTTFRESWFNAPVKARVFISYASADQALADTVASQLNAVGYDTFSSATGSAPLSVPGRFYATAGQRLVLDTKQARKLKVEAEEVSLLGRKMRRDSNSVFPREGKKSRYYVKNEPRRFRKADLGDESHVATIPEIIVSGGIAFGESASFNDNPKALVFNSDHSFSLVLQDDSVAAFALLDPMLQKACFDFARRSEVILSDAIVDIDERNKVKISEALHNTDIGYELIGIDEQPFHYVTNLRAIKSVIIDTAVHVSSTGDVARIDTEYEVRFINPDRRKLAETRAALVYNYDTRSNTVTYRDRWGPRAFRLANIELGELGDQTRRAALVASWAALFRAVEEGPIDFSRGRYEFLKIDKAGKPTPRLSTWVRHVE